MNSDAPAFWVKSVPPGAKPKLVDLTERVIAFTFGDEESKADTLEIDLDNSDLALFDDPHWRHGNVLLVSWGYVGNMSPARQMTIGKITGGRVLKVEALSAAIAMHTQTKSRTWADMDVYEIAKTIGEAYGYKASGALLEQQRKLTPEHRMTTVQAKMTDAQFLAYLAKLHGYVFHVKGENLHFEPRDVTPAPRRKFHYLADPHSDILDFNVENDITVTPAAIVAKGRDLKERKDIAVVASNTDTKRNGLAPSTSVPNLRAEISATVHVPTPTENAAAAAKTTAAAAAAAKVAAAKAAALTAEFAAAVAPPSLQKQVTVLTTAQNGAVAKGRVDGKFTQAQQATVLLNLSVIGDPMVHATQIVDVLGLGKRLSGRYYIKTAKHKLSGASYVLELECRSDGSNGGPSTVGNKSEAATNTKPAEDPYALKPTTVFVDGRTGTTYRK